jgi:hypothetical protein
MLSSLVDENTVLFFADAVPPDFVMARQGQHPSGWYVDEVWMLQHLLKPRMPSGFSISTKVQPAGLIAVRNFEIPAEIDFIAQYQELLLVRTHEELEVISSYKEPNEFFDKVTSSIPGLKRRFTFVDVVAEWSFHEQPLAEGDFVRLDSCHGGLYEKPQPTFIEDLSTRGSNVSEKILAMQNAHATCIDEFENVTIIGANAFVKDQKCYFRTLRPQINMGISRPDGKIQGYANELYSFDQCVAYPLTGTRIPKVVKGYHHYITPDEYLNWAMWLIQAIPSIVDYCQNRDSIDGIISHVSRSWQYSILKDFGIKDSEITYQDVNRRYLVDRMRIIRQTHRDLILNHNERENYRWVAQRLVQHVAVTFPERIFISRLSATAKGAYRALLNEEELIAQLQGIGFVAIEPELLSLPEKIALMSRAKAIVGLGGASMANVIFASQDTPVVTIESDCTLIVSNTNLISSISSNYGIIIGEIDETDPRPNQKRWSLNVPRAVKAIKNFFG